LSCDKSGGLAGYFWKPSAANNAVATQKITEQEAEDFLVLFAVNFNCG
jgi:hypothetical protein